MGENQVVDSISKIYFTELQEDYKKLTENRPMNEYLEDNSFSENYLYILEQ